MIFQTHALVEPLSSHIESIFHFSGFMPDHSIERVVPTGHLFILFELDGLVRYTYDPATLQANGSFTNVWVSGIHRNHLSISAHEDSEMLVIQFKTHGASPFIDMPICDLNDRVLPAEDVFGLEIIGLRNRILQMEDAKQKFRAVEDWLSQRLCEKRSAPLDVVRVLQQLQCRSLLHSSEIIASYPKSHKHLISQFRTHFGHTPKVFHRMFRFNALLQKIHGNLQLNWADVAYEFGYADQSHFIKEFKEFSGFSPQEFIAAGHQNVEPNFFPLDREG